MPSALSSRPPFLTLNPPASPFNPPFNLSPRSTLSSPKSNYSGGDQSGSVSPLTPEPGTAFPEQNDISRVSGFPQASSGFDFGLHNNTVPASPSGERRHSTPSFINSTPVPNVVVPPGGVYRERDVQEGVEAPPPYERYSRYMPVGGLQATRSSIAAAQFPTDPAFPVPTYGRGHHRFASGSGPPRRFSGQRELRSLTLSDMRTAGHGNPQQVIPPPPPPPKKRASWKIFGGTKADAGIEKEPLTNRGKWIIYIAAATTFITIAIVAALVATMRHKGSASVKAHDISGFPTLPAGSTQISPQGAPETPSSACVLPKTLWSCILPPDTLFPKAGGAAGLPTFKFTIKVRNPAVASTSAVQWAPFPERIPSDSEYASLADVDGIQSDKKYGEKTPFYLSMQTDQQSIVARDINSGIDSVGAELPISVSQEKPDTRRSRRSISKRQAAREPSQMLPGSLLNQPLRLFDRGLDTEHYGFFVYYKKTIHVLASDPSSATPFTEASDANGGVSAIVSNNKEVTWENTRFRVAIWTRKRASGQMDVIGDKGQRLSSQAGAFDGSFPYPVSVIEDRNGLKGQVWYGNNLQTGSVVKEEGGEVCSCEWRNWRSGN